VRGDLFRLRPGKDSGGHEQRGPRYAVAIQSDGILLSTLIVAPTSASAQAAIFRPEIEMDGTRTRVLVDQMRAVDASRLGLRRTSRDGGHGCGLPSGRVARLPVLPGDGPPDSCLSVLAGYLVKYQNCGVLSYWVRFSNAVGSVAEMFDFQAQL